MSKVCVLAGCARISCLFQREKASAKATLGTYYCWTVYSNFKMNIIGSDYRLGSWSFFFYLPHLVSLQAIKTLESVAVQESRVCIRSILI
jgi:hypothetical protein